MNAIEYQEFKGKISEYKPLITQLRDSLNIDNLKEKIKKLESKATATDFWDDMQAAQQIMQKTTYLKDKITNIGKKKTAKSSTELQFDKAMSLMENANGLEAVEILEKIADIGIMDESYKQLGTDCLKILGEFYETGKYSNSSTDKDLSKAAGYYEKYTNMVSDGEMIYKVAKMHLETQNFSKAILI